MFFLMIVLLMILFVFSYWLNGRDFFAPTTMQVLTFIVASFACIFYITSSSITYKFHLETVVLIFACLALSTIVGIFVHQIFKQVKVRRRLYRMLHATPISIVSYLPVIFIEIITIIWILSEIQRIGGIKGSFTEMMNAFHMVNSYSIDRNGQLPLLLRQMRHLSTIFFAVFGFNLIKFFKEESRREKVLNLTVIFLCMVVGMLGGARTPVFNMLIAYLIMFHLLLIQKRGKYRTYKVRSLIKLLLLVCAALWGFSTLRGFVGRTNTMDPLTYIAYYIGEGITNLDMYLQNPSRNTDVWGKYTFFNLITNLRTLGLDIKPYVVHLEFRSINGVTTGNVYTFIRTYYSDFGIVGVFILHVVASCIVSVLYEYVKKQREDIGILLFSLGYYSIVLSFFAERFFSTLVSISFIEDIVISMLLYKILIEKVVRIGHRKENCVLRRITE